MYMLNIQRPVKTLVILGGCDRSISLRTVWFVDFELGFLLISGIHCMEVCLQCKENEMTAKHFLIYCVFLF